MLPQSQGRADEFLAFRFASWNAVHNTELALLPGACFFSPPLFVWISLNAIFPNSGESHCSYPTVVTDTQFLG